jgi:copper resistance protein D
MFVYQLSVFLHILSAVIWIGGMFFLALVLVPTSRGLPPAERARLFGEVGRRFRAVGWGCIVVLLLTGVVNMAYRGVTWQNLFTVELWSSPFGTTLALKLGVVVVMLGLSVYHDFVIGPRSVRILSTEPSVLTPDLFTEAQRLRRRASLVGRLEAILALLVLALAVMLVRGVPALF